MNLPSQIQLFSKTGENRVVRPLCVCSVVRYRQVLAVERDLSCAQNVLSSVHYLSEKSLLLIPVVCLIKISVDNKNQSDMIKFHSAFGKVLHEQIA